MAMTTGGGGGYSSDINVTPMIDILLVLLIIFMVIVPVTPKGLDALVPQPPKNPTASSSNRPTAPSWCRFCIAPARRRRTRSTRPTCTRRDLLPRLTEIYANRAERVMFVKGDDDLNFRLHGRGHRHRPRGERGSHRSDDAEDHGRPVAEMTGAASLERGAAGCSRYGGCVLHRPDDAGIRLAKRGWGESMPQFNWGCQPTSGSGQRFSGRKTGVQFFHPGFGNSRPRPARTRIPGAQIDRHDLKEKDTNMNGPARITALAVALAGMVLSMSGCDQLAARDQLNKGVEAYKSAQLRRGDRALPEGHAA